MALNLLTLSSSKKMVKESLLGGGVIAGKNVLIESIEPINGGNRVTFSYTLDDGQKRTSTLDVMNGIDAVSPSITESSGNNSSTYKLDIKTKENTFTTPNLMPSVSLANVITDITLNGNVLIAKKGDGSTKKITLPTVSSGGGNSDVDNTEPEIESVSVTDISLNSSKEIELTYTGVETDDFPSFNVNYSTGELSVNDNGNNNVTFNTTDNNMEVTF